MFLKETLAAHETLKTQLDVFGEPLEETLRRRRVSMQQLQQQMAQLLDKPVAQLCLPDSGRMMGPVGDNVEFPVFGYYELLTDMLRMKDKQALEFRQVLEGEEVGASWGSRAWEVHGEQWAHGGKGVGERGTDVPRSGPQFRACQEGE